MVKKLNPLAVRQKLSTKNISLFTPLDFKRLFNVSNSAVSKFLHTYTKKGFLLKLRNGLYCLNESRPHSFVVANKLYEPSYISLETALSFYNIIPETTHTITSVTTKATRNFTAVDKSFVYHKIKKTSFANYIIKSQNEENFLIAEPEKALLDYLYFVSIGKKSPNDRIDLSEINRKKLLAYAQLFNSTSLNSLIVKLYA